MIIIHPLHHLMNFRQEISTTPMNWTTIHQKRFSWRESLSRSSIAIWLATLSILSENINMLIINPFRRRGVDQRVDCMVHTVIGRAWWTGLLELFGITGMWKQTLKNSKHAVWKSFENLFPSRFFPKSCLQSDDFRNRSQNVQTEVLYQLGRYLEVLASSS